MITTTELKYIKSNAKDVPYPNTEYTNMAFDNLENAFNLFKNTFQGKQYTILLSNGEEIIFEIADRNICHLLGIDFQNLASNYMSITLDCVLNIDSNQQINSFELVERILEKRDEILKHDSNYFNSNYRILNYYRVYAKSKMFSKLENFTKFDFGCINFDKITYEEVTNKVFNPNSTKMLFIKSNESLSPYIFLGLIYDEKVKLYVGETILLDQEFYNYFINQELLLPIELIKNDKKELTKVIATNQEKLQLLRMYKSIIEYYNTGSYINIFNDYETMLNNKQKSKSL